MKVLIITLLVNVSSFAASHVTIHIEAPKKLMVSADALYYAKDTGFRCKELRTNGGIIPGFYAKLLTKKVFNISGKIVAKRSLDRTCEYELDSLSIKARTIDTKSYNSSYIAAYLNINQKGFAVLDCQVNGISPYGTKVDGVACYGDSPGLTENDETTIKFNLK